MLSKIRKSLTTGQEADAPASPPKPGSIETTQNTRTIDENAIGSRGRVNRVDYHFMRQSTPVTGPIQSTCALRFCIPEEAFEDAAPGELLEDFDLPRPSGPEGRQTRRLLQHRAQVAVLAEPVL